MDCSLLYLTHDIVGGADQLSVNGSLAAATCYISTGTIVFNN